MRSTLKATSSLAAMALIASVSKAGEPLRPGVRYRVKTTTSVTISLPVDNAGGQHFYRNASGQWRELPKADQKAGLLTFTLTPEQLHAGSTVLVIGKPDWLDLNDTTPPKVSKALVDGKPVPCAGEINLGWIDAPPRSFELQVADSQNPLDPSSVVANVNGVALRPDGKKFRLNVHASDPKKASIVCSIPDLTRGSGHGTTRIVVECDDFAADDAKCSARLTFTVTRPPKIALDKPAGTAANGIKIFVDSIHSGYENVECMVDGELQVPGTTTYGKTWASAETEADHWTCFVLPKPRQVSGLKISWANYRSTFWTATRYDIMTWDGSQWTRALRVQENPEKRTSTHTFPARTTDRVLVWVPSAGNHPERPNLTWVTEVAFLP